jgi:hypothetical protein
MGLRGTRGPLFSVFSIFFFFQKESEKPVPGGSFASPVSTLGNRRPSIVIHRNIPPCC